MCAQRSAVTLMRPGVKDYLQAAFLAASLVPPAFVVAVLWILPVGELGADRIAMAARDYTDMWAAGHLVALGQGDALFDLAAFNAALRTMFGASFPHQVWPYPPPILLLAVPLSTLPLLAGFLLYTAGTLALLWPALRSGGLPVAACAAVLFSPAVADNALTGQNGGLTAALLFGGLSLVRSRPVLGGAILGGLLIKPQLALLVPICLVASGNWRALLAMAASACLLAALSGILFGLDAWTGFLVHTRPMVAAIIEAPWQALPSQRIFASPLMAARSLGAGLQVAWCVQVATALACAVAAWWAWRTPVADPVLRTAFTGLLAVAAAPWVHTYDMIPLSVAIVLLVATARPYSRILLAFAWFWPGAASVVPIPLPLSVASVTGVAFLAWVELRRRGDAGKSPADGSEGRTAPPNGRRTAWAAAAESAAPGCRQPKRGA